MDRAAVKWFSTVRLLIPKRVALPQPADAMET